MNKDIGSEIRSAREALGWSQEKLATEAGTTQSTVDRIENNGSQRSRFLPEITAILGIPFPLSKRGAMPLRHASKPAAEPDTSQRSAPVIVEIDTWALAETMLHAVGLTLETVDENMSDDARHVIVREAIKAHLGRKVLKALPDLKQVSPYQQLSEEPDGADKDQPKKKSA